MKIYKYIAILAVTLFFTSCERDDDTEVAAQTSNIQVVVEPFGTTATTDIVGQVGANSIVMDFGFRLTDFSTTYFDSDVIITYGGNTYTIPAGDTEVYVGPTNISFDIPAPTGSIPYNGVVTVTQVDLSNTVFDIEVPNRPSDLVVIKGPGSSLNVNTTVYGQIPPVTAGQVNFLFDWNPNDDAGNDLDLRLRMMPGDVAIDYSGSVSNYEDTQLADGDADGMYQVKADAWSTIGGTIDGILFAMHPDGTLEVFETDLTGIAAGGVSAEVVLVNITKSGNTYTLYQ